jgi:DNA-binding CsgD family transcriptional regulator
MRCRAHGAQYKQIAYHLGISFHTVKHHARNAFIKLGALNSTHAIALLNSRV